MFLPSWKLWFVNNFQMAMEFVWIVYIYICKIVYEIWNECKSMVAMGCIALGANALSVSLQVLGVMRHYV
jgi:hypothetical protein